MMRSLARISVIALLLATPSHAQTAAKTQNEVSFGVLGLFHPRTLELEPVATQVVSVNAGGEAFILNNEPHHRHLLFRAENDRLVVRGVSATAWNAAARDGSSVRFRLSIPGRFQRIYEGRLVLTAHRGELIAVVIMDRERAVVSIVAAEMGSGAPPEALKAQAVATRSFLASGSRHRDFDFCDTTHCQYLRSPDDAGSRVLQAVSATQGMVLAWQQHPFPALYSSRCGGRTRSLRESGMDPADGYPYYAVDCAWCRAHPLRWRTRLDSSAAPPQAGNEPARIARARQWGWSALPGNAFTVKSDSSGLLIEGSNIGHSVGLCQAGAIGMAAAGEDFRSILAHYYPNTALTKLP